MKNITVKNLELFLETIFNKFPKLPNKIKTVLTAKLPYLALIFASLFIIFVFSEIISGKYNMFYEKDNIINISLFYFVNLFFIIIVIINYQGLKKLSINSWRSLFYANFILLLIAFVSNLLFSIFFLLLTGINFYLLFQVKSSYH